MVKGGVTIAVLAARVGCPTEAETEIIKRTQYQVSYPSVNLAVLRQLKKKPLKRMHALKLRGFRAWMNPRL